MPNYDSLVIFHLTSRGLYGVPSSLHAFILLMPVSHYKCYIFLHICTLEKTHALKATPSRTVKLKREL